MSVEELLAGARDAHRRLMVDEVSVWRETRGPIDPQTGRHGMTRRAVYRGPARLKAAGATGRDAADGDVTVSAPVLLLPWTPAASGLLPGDLVDLTPGSPAFGPIRLRVEATLPSSTASAYRYEVQRVDDRG